MPKISHISIILLTAKDQTYQKIEGQFNLANEIGIDAENSEP